MSDPVRSVRGMRIDCDTCAVRGPACGDCVVSFLTIPVRRSAGPTAAARAAPAATAVPVPVSAPGGPAYAEPLLDEAEQAAVAVLAAGGLVPPLRMVAGG